MRCVLITGATGAIGSELVPLFLNEAGCQVRLLLRATSSEHLKKRLERLLGYWGLDPADPALAGRVEALAGDVCQARLGLEEDVYGRLAGELTHLVHCAGSVKLNQPLEEAQRSAVDSARCVVELAQACRAGGRLEKLDVVSTVGVAGRMPGLVPERPLREARGFHNTYEAAKAEAEELLFEELEKGLPVTIHRPSMVVGNSQTGRIIRFQVFYYLCEFLSGNKTWGIVVDTGDAKLDIVPVDYVARAIHVASAQPDAVGRVFHLCSGPEGSIRLSDLSEQYRALATRRGERLRRLSRVSPRTFRRLLPWLTRLSWGRTRRALKGLPYFLAYLDEAQAFDVAQTKQYFSGHGLRVPDAKEYLPQVIGFYRDPATAGTGARGHKSGRQP